MYLEVLLLRVFSESSHSHSSSTANNADALRFTSNLRGRSLRKRGTETGEQKASITIKKLDNIPS
ncbi:MAG: hypothetical protein V3S97_05925 [Candidatus Bathyarchaeia archaeon]